MLYSLLDYMFVLSQSIFNISLTCLGDGYYAELCFSIIEQPALYH